MFKLQIGPVCQVVAGVLKILRADLHEDFTTSMAQLGIDPDLDDSSFLFNCSVSKNMASEQVSVYGAPALPGELQTQHFWSL